MRIVRHVLAAWVVNAIVLLVVVAALDDVTDDGLGSLLMAGAVFGILNSVVKPVLNAITFPVRAFLLPPLRAGIAFLIAMVMLGLTDVIVGGFEIDGFVALAVATVAVWVVNLALDLIEWVLFGRNQQAAPAQPQA